jgi:hypothetical protein
LHIAVDDTHGPRAHGRSCSERRTQVAVVLEEAEVNYIRGNWVVR